MDYPRKVGQRIKRVDGNIVTKNHEVFFSLHDKRRKGIDRREF
jgi:hypothetical protein